MKKKIMAVLLTLIFMVGLFGSTAFASTETAVDRTEQDPRMGQEYQKLQNVVTSNISVENKIQLQRSNEIISDNAKGQLVQMKNNELNSIEDYTRSYGNVAYGTVAYILNKIRLFSIPLFFIAIAVSAIHELVLGVRDMAENQKGFNSRIALVTVFVICQVLPLVFAIIVKGWRG